MSKDTISVVGQKFGKWTVISDKFIKNKKSHVKCKCECGSEVDVNLGRLKRGVSKQCSKCRYKSKEKDDKYIGKTFGEIYVIRVDESSKERKRYICRCSCGYEFSSLPHNLIKLNKCKTCKEKDRSILNKRYGRLIVQNEFKEKDVLKCLCKCDCGNQKIIRRNDLLSGKTISCGCKQKENILKIAVTHGKSNTRIYDIWCAMKQRCYYKKNSYYPNYGGRGIKVCDEWLEDFMNFYNWAMKNGYDDTLSIDRIDVNGNYEPSNCRWTTIKEQANNTTRNRYIEYNGKIKTLSQWADELGVNYSTLRTQTTKHTLEEIIGG